MFSSLSRILRQHSLLISVAVSVLLLLSSCRGLLSDSLEYCPRGVYVHLYAQTDCDAERSYPDLDEVRFFVFDSEGLYVSEHSVIVQEQLSATSKHLVPIAKPGTYTIVAWSGLDPQLYKLSERTVGSTRMADLLVELQAAGGVAAEIGATRLYTATTPQVTVEEQINHFVDAEARLRQLTNRLTISIAADDKLRDFDPAKYELRLTAGDVRYTYTGAVLPSQRYRIPVQSSPATDRTLTGQATILMQPFKSQAQIEDAIIQLVERESGDVIFSEGLYEHFDRLASMSGMRVECLHDYDIKLTVRGLLDGSYAVSTVTINGWGVHSYNIELR